MKLSEIQKGISCIAEHFEDSGWDSVEVDWQSSRILLRRQDRKWYVLYTLGTGRLVKYYNRFSRSGPTFEIICEGDAEVSAD